MRLFTMSNTTPEGFASRILWALGLPSALALIFCVQQASATRGEYAEFDAPKVIRFRNQHRLSNEAEIDLSAYNINPVPITPREKSIVEFNLAHNPKLLAEVDQAKRMDGMRFSSRKYVNPGLPKDERETVERALGAVQGLTLDERR